MKKSIEKVGEIDFGRFKTKFKVTNRVKKYIENEGISLSCLLPNANNFYETLLFGSIGDENGKPDKKFGKNFLVIYNKITESLGWNEKKGLEISGFEEKFKSKNKIIFHSGIELVSIKNPKKKFMANYIVMENRISKEKLEKYFKFYTQKNTN